MRLTVKEMAVFGMLAGLMFASKQIMEVLPNVHLLGVFTITITLVYRKKALYPIYGFVLIQGLFSGFALWWIPYLYLWTVLWGAAMLLLPRDLGRVKPLQVMLLCAAHGYLYGTLYSGWTGRGWSPGSWPACPGTLSTAPATSSVGC